MKRYIPFLFLCGACNLFEVRTMNRPPAAADAAEKDTAAAPETFSKAHTDTLPAYKPAGVDNVKNADTLQVPQPQKIATATVQPGAVAAFAQTLIGTPYKYASADPKAGFDCSGFITYVFHYFGIAVPRSSVDFTNVGKTVALTDAKPGDLILFTGTDSTETRVGHMGLIVSNNSADLQFIHSTSGRAKGVVITPLNAYYKKRFVRVARIFPQNDEGMGF